MILGDLLKVLPPTQPVVIGVSLNSSKVVSSYPSVSITNSVLYSPNDTDTDYYIVEVPQDGTVEGLTDLPPAIKSLEVVSVSIGEHLQGHYYVPVLEVCVK